METNRRELQILWLQINLKIKLFYDFVINTQILAIQFQINFVIVIYIISNISEGLLNTYIERQFKIDALQ